MGEDLSPSRQVRPTESFGESCSLHLSCNAPSLPTKNIFLPNRYIFSLQNEEVKVNVRKETGLVNPETGEFLELDIYLPSLKIAFEYQVEFLNKSIPSYLLCYFV